MAWQNLHVTLEITSQSTNGWRLENSTTGRVSVADGTYLFETFPAQGLAAGGPLDPAGDRDATVHAVIDGAVTTVYWLDAENMSPADPPGGRRIASYHACSAERRKSTPR